VELLKFLLVGEVVVLLGIERSLFHDLHLSLRLLSLPQLDFLGRRKVLFFGLLGFLFILSDSLLPDDGHILHEHLSFGSLNTR